MKMKDRNIDLTQGIIWKQLLIFLLPILAGNLFQQLYTTMDAVIVGKFVGKEGLAAIDSVYNLLKLPTNFFIGVSTGATIIISGYFGKKSSEDLSKAVHTAVAFSFTGGIVLSILGIILAPFFLSILEIPEDIFMITKSYVQVYFGGLAISMVYNIGAGILRAIGDSKTPLYYLVISNTINVLLDLLFVGIFHWSVAGAALSTVLSQLVSSVLVIRTLIVTDLDCKLIPKRIKFHSEILKSIFKVGLPIGIQSSMYPIANMMIQANINSMGTDSIAAWALCGKLDFLIWLINDSFSAAIATFTAQNYGANQYKRVRKGILTGMGMTLTIVIYISVILFLWSEPLGKLFINPSDYEILPLTMELMQFLAPMYFMCVFGDVLAGGIHATGETIIPMLLTLAGSWACRILWTLLIVPTNRTMITIIAVYPVSWFITAVSFIMFYAIFIKKKLPVSQAH